MTYREGILEECRRLGIPEDRFDRLWEALMPCWSGHFLLNEKISDSRLYFAALK